MKQGAHQQRPPQAFAPPTKAFISSLERTLPAMADSDAERDANEERETPAPSVGTDPAGTPHQQGTHKEHVELDEEKVREHEREKAREDETPEERAKRIKDA